MVDPPAHNRYVAGSSPVAWTIFIMKIELEYPYSTIYSKGYLVNSQGRNTVLLYNTHEDRSSVSLARYKMAVHLRRFLKDCEHVDHIDGNKSNDSIHNLQILSCTENNRKTHCVGKYILICPICGVSFIPKKNKLWKKDICCSPTCGRIKAVQTKKTIKG